MSSFVGQVEVLGSGPWSENFSNKHYLSLKKIEVKIFNQCNQILHDSSLVART